MSKNAGINGFGRFGLHLLKYWLDRNEHASYTIDYINDSYITLEQAYNTIIKDKYVIFNKYKVFVEDSSIVILEPNGAKHVIQYTNTAYNKINWLGKTDILFECSGKNTLAKNCEIYLTGNTRVVIISATSWDANKTLIYGYNHKEYKSNHQIISYGSCTVNAYVVFADYLNSKYGIEDSEVNVIHNIQKYRLQDNYTLIRKFCTLEKSAQELLSFINVDNFIVNYTVVPYTGVSMIDFRFRFKKPINRESFIHDLQNAMVEGSLKSLYFFDKVDIGPEVYNCTPFSTIIIEDAVKVIGDNVYIHGYFDNENSVNRFFDLTDYIARQLDSKYSSKAR